MNKPLARLMVLLEYIMDDGPKVQADHFDLLNDRKLLIGIFIQHLKTPMRFWGFVFTMALIMFRDLIIIFHSFLRGFQGAHHSRCRDLLFGLVGELDEGFALSVLLDDVGVAFEPLVRLEEFSQLVK